MTNTATPPATASLRSADAVATGASRRLRLLLWGALIALLLAAQALLATLALHYRSARSQEAVEALVAAFNGELSRLLARDLQAIAALPDDASPTGHWRGAAQAVLAANPELLRLERRDPALRTLDSADTRSRLPLFAQFDRARVMVDTELACSAAQRRGGAAYSRSFFVPQPDGLGLEVMDLCVAERDDGRVLGFVVASYSLDGLLDGLLAQQHGPPTADLSFIEAEGSRLAHSRTRVGAGVYQASRLVDLPGSAMLLHANSAAPRPGLLPDLVTSLVIGLSICLFVVVVLLGRDVRRRARAETALAEALAFRKAMEDSVVTGLRARDLQGRTTYVNPAFCAMVGLGFAELVGSDTPPYWPPEHAADYAQRRQARMASLPRAPLAREGFETVFVRQDGERFPAMVFEAPLLDSAGRHTGWMSAVLDLSAQRRVEEVARHQQERLQATARLATVGEMASLLSHELNQPLSAIAAYATGSLNMMDDAAAEAGPELAPLLRQATQRIAEQAERAGRVIKSVHDFVRRRESTREPVAVDALIEAVLPLVRLQARKSEARIEVDVAPQMPKALCDRAMVEQVLLNLTRNGIQAMQGEGIGPGQRALVLRVRQLRPQWLRISVADGGPGVDDEVAKQLFTPFFTTREDGMGLGLSVCRGIVEHHGGALDVVNLRDAEGRVVGAEFGFTLPAAAAAASPKTPAAPAAGAVERIDVAAAAPGAVDRSDTAVAGGAPAGDGAPRRLPDERPALLLAGSRGAGMGR